MYFIAYLKKIIKSGCVFKVLWDLHAKLSLALMNYLHKFPFNQ